MEEREYDITIIGGGPVGLFTAFMQGSEVWGWKSLKVYQN